MTGTGGSFFGGDQRAADGIIVTFVLPDGDTWIEQFSQLVFTQTRKYERTRKVVGGPAVVQAAERADALGAKIRCISSPETIKRDLEGVRTRLKENSNQRTIANGTVMPEVQMLGNIGRSDLLEPHAGFDNGSRNIRQVRQRRPIH